MGNSAHRHGDSGAVGKCPPDEQTDRVRADGRVSDPFHPSNRQGRRWDAWNESPGLRPSRQGPVDHAPPALSEGKTKATSKRTFAPNLLGGIWLWESPHPSLYKEGEKYMEANANY